MPKVSTGISKGGVEGLSPMKQVPFLDLKAQYATLRSEIREAIDRVCDSQQFILGPEVKALEKEVAAFCEVRHAIGVSSGTDALLAALMALGIGPGDEIITTTYSFFATAGVIARVGARPVFIDIDPETFNLNSGGIAAAVTSKTKAVIPVHLFGQCADMESVMEVARRNKLYVIEDAAQALGARDKEGRQAGTIGDVGCFSFFPTKNVGGFGDGGMVVTHDDGLAELLRVLRVHGGKPKYHHKIVGGNFRLDAIQAAVLRVKLKYLPAWIGARRRNADRYRVLFDEFKLLELVVLPIERQEHTYNQFATRFPDRDRLQVFLRDRGVETEVYYPVPLHLQECFSTLGFRQGDFLEAESAARDCLALPVYPELTEEQQRYVVHRIREFYQ